MSNDENKKTVKSPTPLQAGMFGVVLGMALAVVATAVIISSSDALSPEKTANEKTKTSEDAAS